MFMLLICCFKCCWVLLLAKLANHLRTLFKKRCVCYLAAVLGLFLTWQCFKSLQYLAAVLSVVLPVVAKGSPHPHPRGLGFTPVACS